MGDSKAKKGGGLINKNFVIHSPNLSVCHRCGLSHPINGVKTLDSMWRIVLLCRECLTRVKSAQVCSYCFSWFPDLEKRHLDCNICSRRVHRACVSLHHRNFSNSLLDAASFACVDCRPIPRLRREDLKKSSLQDFAKGAVSKGKARGNEAKRGLKRKAFDAEREGCEINLSVPDEKTALQLHQRINGSKRISRSLGARKEQLSCDSVFRISGSNSCTYNKNKSVLEGRGKSVSILNSSTLFTQENGDLVKQSSLNTRLRRTMPLAKYGFSDCDGAGSSKLQRKSVDAMGANGVLKKYFRKSWESGRIIRGNSPSIFSDSPLFKQDNEDVLKRKMVCSTGSPRDFSLQEKELSLKFQDSIDDGSNANSTLLPHESLKSTMPVRMDLFAFCDRVGCSKLQRKSVDAICCPGRPMKRYFRKQLDSGRIMQDNALPFLTNNPLFKHKNGVLMKQSRRCNAGYPGDFFLEEASLKLPDSTDDVSNAGPAALPCQNLNTWSNNFTTLVNYRFSEGEGSSKLQRKSIDAIACRSMKKYFRKHWSSERILKESSESILVNSPLFKKENGDLMNQTRGCTTGCSRGSSLNEKVSSLQFSDSTNDGSNTGSALLTCHSLNTWLNSTILPTNDSFRAGDGERSKGLQRKPIDAIVSDNMKKYYRKRWGSKIVMHGNSQSISPDSPLFKQENGDMMMQTRGCDTSCLGAVFSKEDIFLDSPVSTEDGSNIDSALLQFHGLNTCLDSTMPLKKYSFCDEDGVGCSKLQRKSIDAIGSDGSLKKYFRKHLGS